MALVERFPQVKHNTSNFPSPPLAHPLLAIQWLCCPLLVKVVDSVSRFLLRTLSRSLFSNQSVNTQHTHSISTPTLHCRVPCLTTTCAHAYDSYCRGPKIIPLIWHIISGKRDHHRAHEGLCGGNINVMSSSFAHGRERFLPSV